MKARVFFIMTLLLPSVNVKASGAKEASPEAHGSAPSKDEHSTAKPATSQDGHGGKAGEHGDAKAGPPPSKTDHYVHRWLAFPTVTALNLGRERAEEIKPVPGRVTILVFLASWCVPCQQQIREFKKIEDKYRDQYTDFVYIFAHDTESDARGFSKVYQLGSNAMLASASVLEAFHQPELPSFYVSDRYKWLVMRRLNTQKKDLDELGQFLSLHTAL